MFLKVRVLVDQAQHGCFIILCGRHCFSLLKSTYSPCETCDIPGFIYHVKANILVLEIEILKYESSKLNSFQTVNSLLKEIGVDIRERVLQFIATKPHQE